MSDAAGADSDDVAATIPLGRIGQPEDIAAMVGFLVSDRRGRRDPNSLYGAFGGEHDLYLRALDSYRNNSAPASHSGSRAPALERIRALLLDTAHAVASDTE